MKLSFGGSKKKQKSEATQVSTPNVPGYIQQPVTDYYGQVRNFMGGPQPQTFGPSTLQTQAFNAAGAMAPGPNANVAQGADIVRNGAGFTPQAVQAGQLATTNLTPYMDPYNQQVVDAFENDWAHGNEVGLNQIRARTGRGSYGGSRQGVAEGQFVGDSARTLASTLAALRSGGFDRARTAAQSDIAGRYGADTFNSNMWLQGAQFRQGAGESLASMGFGGDANARAMLGLKSDLGAQQREITQQGDPATARARWLAQMQALLGLNPESLIGNTTNQKSKSSGSEIGFDFGAKLFGG